MIVDYKSSPPFKQGTNRHTNRFVGIALISLFTLCLTFIFLAPSKSNASKTNDTISLPLPVVVESRSTAVLGENATVPQPVSKGVAAPRTIAQKAKPLIDKVHTIKIRSRDTLAKIFKREGLPHKDLKAIQKSDKKTKLLATLQPGQTLKLQMMENKQVVGLTLDLPRGRTIQVARTVKGFQIEDKQAPLEKQIAFGKGKIHDSLFSSAKRAGLDPIVISQMVDIFDKIDFHHDLRPNDTFRVLFEEKYFDGEKVETGHILAAELVNAGRKNLAIRYTDKKGNTGYYSPEGQSLNQMFLRYPVNFTRISSTFGLRRHPICHKMRHHKGIDFSAPRGTPVQATSDGKVIYAGTRRGYGKAVEIQHGLRYTTLYAHLSGFGKNIRVGSQVRQGEVIGYVGHTGLASGDHLHYEFRMDGIHRDPATSVALPRKGNVSDKRHFVAHAKEMMRLMDIYDSKINVASVPFPLNE